MQNIIVTRKGNINEKLIIEVQGDKVTVNGKDAKENKDVIVRTQQFKDNSLLLLGTQGNTWNFNWDENEHFSFFSEDSTRAMLGVSTTEDEKGAEVTSVNKESAAEKAGLRKGDIITKISDHKIVKAEDVTKAIKTHKPGDKVAVHIIRNGKEQTLTAELDKWKGLKINKLEATFPMAPMRPMPPFASGMINSTGRPKLGLSIQDTDNGKGVMVLNADDEGNAAKAGVKEKDIITHVDGKAINSTDEITKIIRESRDKSSIRLQVLRNGKTQNIEVKIPRILKTSEI
jgi:serine protease Do